MLFQNLWAATGESDKYHQPQLFYTYTDELFNRIPSTTYKIPGMCYTDDSLIIATSEREMTEQKALEILTMEIDVEKCGILTIPGDIERIHRFGKTIKWIAWYWKANYRVQKVSILYRWTAKIIQITKNAFDERSANTQNCIRNWNIWRQTRMVLKNLLTEKLKSDIRRWNENQVFLLLTEINRNE